MTTNSEQTENPDIELMQLEKQAEKIDAAAGLYDSDDISENEQNERAPLDAELLELVTNVVGVTAHTFAPNWDLKPTEIRDISSAYAKLLQKYLPDNGFDKYGEEINAVLITLIIVQSRKGKPLKIDEKPKKNSSSNGSHEQNERDNEAPDAQTVINDTNSKQL